MRGGVMTKPSRQLDYLRDRHALRNSLTLKIDMAGFTGLIDELAENAKDAIRPAAQAAAQVIYDEVKANVSQIKQNTGNLNSSIYQVYSKMLSGPHNAVYHVSYNSKTAPYAGLLEYGHIQRYAVHLADDGKWYTLVRPEKRGTKPPRRRASQAEKDAYYVLRKGGPVQWLGKAFMRRALDKVPLAVKAAEDELRRRILEGNK